MRLDPQLLRTVALIVLISILYAGRISKGSAKEVSEGLQFGMKPLVLWSRLTALVLYLAVIFYPLFVEHRRVPIWVPLVVIAVMVFAAYQLPGTILLTTAGVVQRFWMRADKVIEYPEVMTIQSIQGGRIIRVLGDNRVIITHNSTHVDAERFRQEMERRTGKLVTG